jgi:hypothetical protein
MKGTPLFPVRAPTEKRGISTGRVLGLGWLGGILVPRDFLKEIQIDNFE